MIKDVSRTRGLNPVPYLPALVCSTNAGSTATIMGSLANIIVVDEAASKGLKISFGEHARVGVPVTLISLLVAAGWLWFLAA